MRYQTGLASFYQAASESCLVALVAPPYGAPAQPLPRYVEYRPTAVHDYIKALLSEAAVIA